MQRSPNLHFQVTLQVDIKLWRFPCYINKPSLVQIGLQLFKWAQFHIFSLSYNLTSDDVWPWYMTFDQRNIWTFTYYINEPSLVPIRLQLFKWGHFQIFNLSYNLTSDDLWPWYMTFVTTWTYEGSHIIAINQVWFQSDFQLFQWGHFHISAYLTTWPQMTFDFDVTSGLINKWGFPCCIYDLTLVEIHQSMCKVEPNVNLFSQQQTTVDKVIPVCLSC